MCATNLRPIRNPKWMTAYKIFRLNPVTDWVTVPRFKQGTHVSGLYHNWAYKIGYTYRARNLKGSLCGMALGNYLPKFHAYRSFAVAKKENLRFPVDKFCVYRVEILADRTALEDFDVVFMGTKMRLVEKLL